VDTRTELESWALEQLAGGRPGALRNLQLTCPNRACSSSNNADMPGTIPKRFPSGSQFVDFAHGAQVSHRSFIISAEKKWGSAIGVSGAAVAHGQKGQGRTFDASALHRTYCQLTAGNNIRVCHHRTPRNIFNSAPASAAPLEQALVVFTPRACSLPDASSPIEDFFRPQVLVVVPRPNAKSLPQAHPDLQRKRARKNKKGVRIERNRRRSPKRRFSSSNHLSSVSEEGLRAEIAAIRMPEIVGCREPANMGALSYVMPRFSTTFKDSGALGEALGERQPGD